MKTQIVSSSLKVVSVGETKEASDGRLFFTVGFRAGFGQKPAFRNFWQQYRKDAEGIALEPKQAYWERATPEEAEALLKSGETIEGRKVTHTVESYYIGENLVNTYSTVVFPDENEITVFNQSKHPIVDPTTGELIEGAKQPKAVMTADPAEEEEEEEEVAPKTTKAAATSKNANAKR